MHATRRRPDELYAISLGTLGLVEGLIEACVLVTQAGNS